jgi:hypothetical protein
MDSKDNKKSNYTKAVQDEIARLEADKKAIIEEFEKVASEELTPEVVKEKIRKEILPAAWVSLQHLIVNAESEAIRANLIKWAFDFSSKLERPRLPENNPDKELAELLKAIGTGE